METTEFLGIDLAPTAKSAILIEETMAGQPVVLWIELFSKVMKHPQAYLNNPYWESIFQSQADSGNAYVRYTANLLRRNHIDDDTRASLRQDPSLLVSLIPSQSSISFRMELANHPTERFWSLPAKA